MVFCFYIQEATIVMKTMEEGSIGRGSVRCSTDGRRTRALAKRCIVLTEENKVTMLFERNP